MLALGDRVSDDASGYIEGTAGPETKAETPLLARNRLDSVGNKALSHPLIVLGSPFVVAAGPSPVRRYNSKIGCSTLFRGGRLKGHDARASHFYAALLTICHW